MRKPIILIGYSCCPLTLEAFERSGCEAWTCDILPSRGRPDRHIQADIRDVALDRAWDAALFHPMCTYLTAAAAWAFKDPDFDRYPDVGYHQKLKADTLTGKARRAAQSDAVENFKWLDELPYPKAIENPWHSYLHTLYRKADQCIHPYQFGDDASKATGLWIRGLPKIRPTGFVEPRMVCCGNVIEQECSNCGGEKTALPRWGNQTNSGQNKLTPGDHRWLERSKTYPGIAAAFGDQWGGYLVQQLNR